LIKETSTGIEIAVRVLPRARKTAIAGTRGDALLVRLAAPPVDGAANAALVELLARSLHVPPSAIHILTGDRSRNKRVAVAGTTVEDLKRALKL
jgi:uncharacterized protein (TIGR00251 family)